MKVFVTGVSGQLGHDCVNELMKRGHTAVGSDIQPVYSGNTDGSPVTRAEYVQMDITDGQKVMEILERVKPDVVIHCAAWTAVDAAEAPENRDKVYAVNVKGTANIADACREIGAAMVYISTDYIFDGKGTEPWTPECEEFHPISWYGQSKLDGELAVRRRLERYFIVRIAWAFGQNGKNFIRTMLNLGQTRKNLRVVDDQIGTPTYTLDLARLLVDMIETEKFGIYHATNEGGYISWADFAKAIFEKAGMDDVTVTPVHSSEYGLSAAARPENSRLDKSKLVRCGFEPLPTWQDALDRYLKAISDAQ